MAVRCTPTRRCWPASRTAFDWPEVDERSAAAMCYTSGTTGHPKGVVYSHRSMHLHSMAVCMNGVFGLSDGDRVLPVVPMFHANAWGLPYAAVLAGASLIMPDRFLQPEPLVRLIEAERPTLAGAVPDDLERPAPARPGARRRPILAAAGALRRFRRPAFADGGLREGTRRQHPPGLGDDRDLAARQRRASARRRCPRRRPGGTATPRAGSCARSSYRLIGEGGIELPCDGEAVGEIEVRGPWITGSYYKDDDPAKFRDGWLRTGDVGTIDPLGYVTLTDRAKDVIKSGGEWISSMELENVLMAHPDVSEAAVIGVADEKWGERPLAAVVLRRGRHRDRSPSSVPSWPSAYLAGSYPSAGRSSPRCPRPASASSPRPGCATPTQTATTRSSRRADAQLGAASPAVLCRRRGCTGTLGAGPGRATRRLRLVRSMAPHC